MCRHTYYEGSFETLWELLQEPSHNKELHHTTNSYVNIIGLSLEIPDHVTGYFFQFLNVWDSIIGVTYGNY